MIAKEIEVASNGILSFHVRDGSDRPWWSYLDIDGKPAYLIGNMCGTCSAMFQRCSSSLPLTSRQLSNQLENGIEMVSQEAIDTVSALLPKGEYLVSIIDVLPSLVKQKMNPNMMGVFCESDYFWWQLVEKYPNGQYNEIVLPMVSEDKLNPERVDYYSKKMKEGLHPTALALSLLDSRVLRGENPVDQLAHFVLDGHHKIMAASKTGLPISILSFLFISDFSDSKYYAKDVFLRKHYHIK
jgi:hypothetical protein